MDKLPQTPNDIDVELLGRFGLSREMLEDLPTGILRDLANERHTPPLPVTVGDTKIYARICILRTPDPSGNNVIFCPRKDQHTLDRFNESQREALLDGKPVIATLDGDRGPRHAFHQIDPSTRQVMSVPTEVIGHNLQVLADTFNLSNASVAHIRDGGLITIAEDMEIATIGIDLNATTGIRMTRGDEKQWLSRPLKDYQKYNFGTNGCWVTGDDGTLDYVSDNAYTEEIHQELKRQGLQRRESAGLRR